MRRTDGLTRGISLLLFAAMLCYMGFAVARRVAQPVRTALAVDAVRTESVRLSGLVLRDEELIRSDRSYIDVTAAEGEKIAAGGAVATVYTSAEALDRALRLHALETELAQAEASLAEEDGSERSTDAVYAALTSLSVAVRSGELTETDVLSDTLASLVFTGGQEITTEYLRALQKEYDDLAASAARDAETVTAERAGSFSSITDGYEDVTPEAAADLAPAELEALLGSTRRAEAGAVGKLIGSFTWYYAALMDEADAARLTEGEALSLSFGLYCGGSLGAEVRSVGAPEDGRCVVLFALDEGLSSLLAVRKAAAELVFSECSGVRVPDGGLWRYYAGWMDAADAETLSPGESVILAAGGASRAAAVSEIGGAEPFGELPAGIEAGSEADTRPGHCQIVVYWPWAEDNALDAADGARLVTSDGAARALANYYADEAERDCLCVFTMTGQMAERKKVSLVCGGAEYCLVSSEGTDALREGNEIIVEAAELFAGRVFD